MEHLLLCVALSQDDVLTIAYGSVSQPFDQGETPKTFFPELPEGTIVFRVTCRYDSV
jgi:hypothetical protein